jgi:fatty-acyl-CoA synthase
VNDDLTLTRLLRASAAAGANRSALVYRDRSIGFEALETESARVATGLAELGIGKGDRVALWLPNTPAWLACFFACCRLGATALATNTRFRSAEMEDILGRAEVKVLVYWPAFRGIDFSRILEDMGPPSGSALRAIVAYAEHGDPEPPQRVHGVPVHRYDKLTERSPMTADAADAELGCLMFTTSGTTKAPKFVLHPQRTIVQHARDVARGFKYLGADTVGLGALPFCGTYGFSTAIAPLAAAAPLIVEASFEPERVIALIQRHRVTNTNLTGHMIAHLIAAQPPADAFATLRACGCGSGAGEVIAPAAAVGLRVSGVYGSSEVQALFSFQDDFDGSLAERALGGGWPVSPYAQVRVRDVGSGALLPHGEAGELEIKAPSRMIGYFGNAEATREAITADGFYRTGDLGHTLADGRFIFQARLGDALRLSGFLVSPAQIESVIAEHSSIAACQVVGLDVGGEVKPYAFVICKPGSRFDEADVLVFARSRMARYKLPARIVRLDEFPTVQSANAIKVQKAKLRGMARSLIGAGTQQA